MVVAWRITKHFYNSIKQSIKRLVEPAKVFCMRLSIYKYLHYFIVRYFRLVI